MYHYLGEPPPREAPHHGLTVPPLEFREHLALLRQARRRVVTGPEYADALDAGDARGIAWITFDDGRVDNHEIAFPMLAESNMGATFFVIVERSLSGDPEHIPVAALREMAAAGMEIGSHSMTHPHLARIAPEQLRAEVAGSKKRLEDALGIEVASFCYPYGNWNAAVVEAVREAGYRLAVSTIRDNRNTPADRWHLRRAMVQPGRTGWRFNYLFSPLYHWVHERKNRRRWRERET